MWMYWMVLGALLIGSESLDFYDGSDHNQANEHQALNPSLIPNRELRSAIFWTGSRYNRRDSPRTMDIKPRNSGFFMGSRYGKRTPLHSERKEALEGTGSLLCKMDSLKSYYLCNRMNGRNV